MTIDLKDFHERELHPFLNHYLHHTLGISAKTILQERSTNTMRGENEWIHPDIIGFSLPLSNWNEKIVELFRSDNNSKVLFHSFELKKEITMSSLREDYFQAVSNSSWANEGYLVAAKIDTDDVKLMQKMSRLNSSFGIGIILLDLHDPTKSEILFESKLKETIDGESINHLYEINQDVQDFLKSVEYSLKINRAVSDHLDILKSKKELDEILDKSNSTSTPTTQPTTHTKITGSSVFDWDSSVVGTKPLELSINNKLIPTPSWKDVYISICNHIIDLDVNKFNTDIAPNYKGRSKPYFSLNENDLRVAFALDKTNYFAEINLSSDHIIRICKKMITDYNLNLNDFRLVIDL